jgi:predicted metal-dependent hydrolase
MLRSKASVVLPRPRLTIQGLSAPVEVRRHPCARRLTLRISQTRRAVIVTMPLRCRVDEAGHFINRNIEWVRKHLGDLPAPIPFADGMTMPLRGRDYLVQFTGPRRGGAVVSLCDAGTSRAKLCVSGTPEHAPRRLKDWLIKRASDDLDERVRWHAHNIGVRAKRISVRDQTSRWGSCSTTGVLSFSWRLILAPSLVLDYVAAHEVAHLVEMNHGPRFWQLVARTMPDLEAAKSWLHANGMQLHRYGATGTGA